MLFRSVAVDNERAAALFKEAASKGNPRALKNLGYMYYFGAGVSKDVEKAKELFRQSAGGDEASAQFALGSLYYIGEDVPRDYAKAFELLKRSAEQGYAKGQMLLGRMYARGEGVERSLGDAWFWLLVAEAQEPVLARHYKAEFADQVSDAERREAEARAGAWMPRD